MGPGALRRLPAAHRRRDHLARVGRAVRRARAEAHLRRARHAPPARRDPEGQAARGPARRRLGRRHRGAVLHGVPAVVRRATGLPGPPARRVGARGVGGPRLPGGDLPGRPRRRRPAGRVRHDHRGLDRPGRGGARVARPGPRGAPRRAVAAGARQGRLRPGLARRQRRQPGPRALPPARLRGPRRPGPLHPAHRRRRRPTRKARERHPAASLSLAGCPTTPRSSPVAMRMSSLFLRTLRENPADAEVPSHQLLVRAGYIRRVSPGIYTWLPLGPEGAAQASRRIVREEMDAIGAQELLFPALLPREPYEASGRWDEYGDNVFRLKDRKGADYLLGPTHEEMFTLAVKDLYSSYKDLPLSIYQIQIKYRDEARPRAGLLRGREFVMKDSYSFDIDEAGLDKSYQLHRDAYVRIFDRLGFHYVIVAGDGRGDGRLEVGGVPRDRRERRGHLRALHATAATPPTSRPCGCRCRMPWTSSGVPAAHVEDTPDTPTIDTLVAHLESAFPRADGRAWAAVGHAEERARRARAPRRHPRAARHRPARRPRGRREAARRAGRAGRRSRPSTRRTSRPHPALAKGYIGPGVLGDREGVRHPLPARPPGQSRAPRWVTGADEPGRHVIDLVAGRDFTADGTIEAAEVRDGDACPLVRARAWSRPAASRWATSSSSARKYAEALDLKVLDENGKLRTVIMGSYGVGVSRAVACVAEGNHDELGLVWPRALGPGRRARRRHRQGRGRRRPTPRSSPASSRRAGVAGAARRPPPGQPRREVQGRRADRRADHRRRRARPGRRHHRGQGPPLGRAARRGGRRRRSTEILAEIGRS